jgi:hypothetical protein
VLNSAVVLPPATGRVAGTVTRALLEESWTLTPPGGAAPERVIWHAFVPPPVRVGGVQDTEFTETLAFTWASKVSDCEAPPTEAVNVAVELAVTAAAFAVNVAPVRPELMVTVGGIATAVLLEPSVTNRLLCAGLPNVRVHVADPGVCTVAGVQISVAVFCDGLMASTVETAEDPALAWIVEVPLGAPAATAALKLAVVAPA